MKAVIEKYRPLIIQIATPQSTGTGFYLQDFGLIVTNHHVIEGNREVVVLGEKLPRQMVKVLFTDIRHDLAFLQKPDFSGEMPSVRLGLSKKVTTGERVVAVGHPFGLKFSATQGIVSNPEQMELAVPYIHHDAALNPGNSGGPLINDSGEVVGVNTFIIRDGNNVGFSLPVEFLDDSIQKFLALDSQNAARCASCTNLVSEKNIDKTYCPFCGTKVELPASVDVYEPTGISRTMERILEKIGHNIPLARIGPDSWEIRKGSAKISISYDERNGGLISADAWLAELPLENAAPIYSYLLRENYALKNLTLSVDEQDILLSLLIFDRHLNEETGLKMLSEMFEKADHYDDILVKEFGAKVKKQD